MKLLTKREAEMFRALIDAEQLYRDCNPDVGMGTSVVSIAKRVASKLSFNICAEDIKEAVERYAS